MMSMVNPGFGTGSGIPKLELGNERKLELGNEKKLELGNEKKKWLFRDIFDHWFTLCYRSLTAS